jgi:hypothetical protein
VALAEKLNEVLHQWTYRKHWDWAVAEKGTSILVHFSWWADDARYQTARMQQKDVHYSYGMDPYPTVNSEMVHDALPGRSTSFLTIDAARMFVETPEYAMRWLETQLRSIEEHEFREFFRYAKTNKCVIDPHPEYAPERKERETLGVVK